MNQSPLLNSQVPRGICPLCDGYGSVGAPCTGTACRRMNAHFLPPREALHAGHGQEDTDPRVGRRLQNLLLVERVAVGGFGTVYRALCAPDWTSEVAVKFLELPDDERLRKILPGKFEQEAEILQRLDHPNIVKCYEVRTDTDPPLLVMEYLSGWKTLRDDIINRLSRRDEWYTPFQVASILRQMLDGLDVAHQEGVLHRDVKPENIMAKFDGQQDVLVKLIDFGTAKVWDGMPSTTKLALGSPTYMAPEQLDMMDLGPWTDVYAVGAVAFELLTGLKPFPGSSDEQILRNKLSESFDPFDHVELDYYVARVLRRALAREREDRYQSVADLRLALDSALSTAPHSEPSASAWMHDREATSVAEYEQSTRINDGDYETPSSKVQPDTDKKLAKQRFRADRLRESVDTTLTPMPGDQPGDQPDPYEPDPYEPEIDHIVRRPEDDEPESLDQRHPTDEVLALSEPPPSRGHRASATFAAAAVVMGILGGWGVGHVLFGPVPNGAEAATNAAIALEAMSSSDLDDTRITNLATAPGSLCLVEHSGNIWCADQAGTLNGEPMRESGRLADLRFAAPGQVALDVAISNTETGTSACVLLNDGNVRCWGANHDGRLGYGHDNDVTFRDIAVKAGAQNVPLGGASKAIAATSESAESCALLESGVVKCWGPKEPESVPAEANSDKGVQFVQLDADPPTIDLFASRDRFCALADPGRLRCWTGLNIEEVEWITLPVPIAEVALGAEHGCARSEDGRVWCWGSNESGQLGHYTSPSSESPVRVALEAPTRAIAAGARHTCALTKNQLVCWGDNAQRQLLNSAEPVLPPTHVALAEVDEVLRLAAGDEFTCAFGSTNFECLGNAPGKRPKDQHASRLK